MALMLLVVVASARVCGLGLLLQGAHYSTVAHSNSTAGVQSEERRQTQQTPEQTYRRLRWTFSAGIGGRHGGFSPSGGVGGNSNGIRIGEIRIGDAPMPPGIAYADFYWQAGYEPANAFDGNPATEWDGYGTPSYPHQSIMYTLDSPASITDYSISTMWGECPAAWVLEATNDLEENPEWTQLDAQTGQTCQKVCTRNEDCVYPGCDEIDLATCDEGVCYTGTKSDGCAGEENGKNNGKCRDDSWCYGGRCDHECPFKHVTYQRYGPAAPTYIKLRWTFGASGNATSIRIADIRVGNVELLGTATAADGTSPANAFDGNLDTEWRGYTDQPITYTLDSPASISEYSISTKDGECPTAWVLEATNHFEDNPGPTKWTQLDAQTGQTCHDGTYQRYGLIVGLAGPAPRRPAIAPAVSVGPAAVDYKTGFLLSFPADEDPLATLEVQSHCNDPLSENMGERRNCTYDCGSLKGHFFPGKASRCFAYDTATDRWPEELISLIEDGELTGSIGTAD
jgi:hypothetical protein